jgi:predicted site-specific integrase-resolvase
MDPAQPNKPIKFLSLKEAAKLLEVDVETLLKWNESNILKANITPEGEIGYTQDQLEQFLLIKNQSQAANEPTGTQRKQKRRRQRAVFIIFF